MGGERRCSGCGAQAWEGGRHERRTTARILRPLLRSHGSETPSQVPPSVPQNRVLYTSSLLAQWTPEEAAKLPAPSHGVGSTLAAMLHGSGRGQHSADCVDKGGVACMTWAKEGECTRNAQYMENMCKRSCQKCY